MENFVKYVLIMIGFFCVITMVHVQREFGFFWGLIPSMLGWMVFLYLSKDFTL